MESEIYRALMAYFDDYFDKRDLKRTMTHFSQHITGFGSSMDENTYDFERCYSVFERDIVDEAPSPIEYKIEQLKITNPVKEAGFVSCQMAIKTTIQNQHIKLNDLRYTLAFVLENGQWKIAQKHLSFPSKVNYDDEGYPVKELEARNEALSRMVEQKTIDLHQALEEIKHLANHDTLTGLANRLSLDASLEQYIESPDSLGIMMLDVDGFKSVNDTFGHLNGDDVLKDLAHLMKKQLPESCTIGRWGGDEFLIMCPAASKDELMALSESLRQSIAAYHHKKGMNVTASFGLTLKHPDDDSQTIIMRCDKALYKAKKAGKNRIQFDQ